MNVFLILKSFAFIIFDVEQEEVNFMLLINT